MNINGLADYGRVQYNDSDGMIIKKEAGIQNAQDTNQHMPDTQPEDNSNELLQSNNRKLLSVNEFMNMASRKDFTVDKELIGTESDITQLDRSKAFSLNQRDRILMEYQTFIRNPETQDGVIRKIK